MGAQSALKKAIENYTLANEYCADGMLILNDTLGENTSFTQQLQEVCDEIKESSR